MKRKTTAPPRPVRSRQVPLTVDMLNEMEERLVHKIDSGHLQLKSELTGLRAEFTGLKADFTGLKSEFSGVKSELHRVALLVEEQNARNKFVLDGYGQLYELIERKLG